MEKFFVNQINDNQIVIGGVKKLTEFSSCRVVAAVAGAQVVICGEKLKIARFDENEICIEGKITSVETLSSRVRRSNDESQHLNGTQEKHGKH